MNTPVNFKIAKLLKEKGFKNGIHYDGVGGYFTNTTIAEVVMWLYEKYGIWIWGKFQKRGTFVFVIENTKGENITISPDFNTPTEAYEAGIEYCLTKLIKVL